jgi:hypothetical protein
MRKPGSLALNALIVFFLFGSTTFARERNLKTDQT